MPVPFRIGISILWLLLVSAAPLRAEEKEPNLAGDPEIVSVFPMGARQGAVLQAQVRGRNLNGTYAVWFSSPHLQARVEAVEEISDLKAVPQDETRTKEGHRVLLRLGIDATAGVGNLSVRLLSPRGVSNALSFNVTGDPVIREIEASHPLPDQAQEIHFPVIVNGRLSAREERSTGTDLTSSRIKGCSSKSGGALGSWSCTRLSAAGLNAGRAIRLAINERAKPRLSYRFQKEGQYLLQVKSLLSDGGPDTVYQLRVAPASRAMTSQAGKETGRPAKSGQLVERTFTRKLAPNRLQVLWSRTVQKPVRPAMAPVVAAVIEEREPNETAGQALKIAVPIIIEGAIDRPGDVDCFQFQVQQGDQLAFEVETPQSGPLLFNPRLGITDQDGNEFLTNIYKRIVRNFTFYQKDIQPKTVYTFRLGGNYTLQVRDLTSRHGDPSFLYRVLIRPQVPHAGEVRVLQDRINLKRGKARKLTLITEQEEGFDGEIALSVENLPEGVRIYPGTDVEPPRGPPVDEGYKERFVPKRRRPRSCCSLVRMLHSHGPRNLSV